MARPRTSTESDGQWELPPRPRKWPLDRWFLAFGASVLVGLAIWIPTMALQPRYSYGANQDNGSGWYFPLMLGAAVLLTVAFPSRWPVIAPGLIAPQLMLAFPTTPRGDNDGLWLLIFPMLVAFACLLLICSALVSLVVMKNQRRRVDVGRSQDRPERP